MDHKLHSTMTPPTFRFVGVELYFADLQRAQEFYQHVLVAFLVAEARRADVR